MKGRWAVRGGQLNENLWEKKVGARNGLKRKKTYPETVKKNNSSDKQGG